MGFPLFLETRMNYKAILIAAAQAAALFLSGFFVPLLGMILTPVPLVLAYVRQGRSGGLAAISLSVAVVGVIIGWPSAIVLLLCFGLMAIGTAEGMRRRWKPESAAFAGGLLPAIALTLAAARFFFHTDKNPVTFLEALIHEQRSLAAKLYTDLKLTEVAAAVMSVPDTFIHYFVLLLPGIVITSLLVLAAVCFVLAVRIVMRRPQAGPAMNVMPLSAWYAPDIWVWGLIVTLALIIARNEAAKFTGWNLAILYAVIYLTQGIAIVEYALKKMRIQPIVRGLLHVIILALPPVVAGVIALGVVDVWADFRKVRGPLTKT
jgi:uncharacterized protein YybS (DUF2232 family)